MLSYPVRVLPTDNGCILLVFPDLPEVDVLGTSEDEAFAKATAALEAALAAYVVEGRPLPTPSDICGAPSVETSRFSIAGMNV